MNVTGPEIILEHPVELSTGQFMNRLAVKPNAQRGPDFRTSAANLFGVTPAVIDELDESDLRRITSFLNTHFAG